MLQVVPTQNIGHIHKHEMISGLKVGTQFLVIDRFGAKYKITEIEYQDGPSWLYDLITAVDKRDIRLALDGYPEPLILKIRYTPIQIFDRIPPGFKYCTMRKGCYGWKENVCTNLAKNTCPLIQLPDMYGNLSSDLTKLYHLWKEDYNLVRVT